MTQATTTQGPVWRAAQLGAEDGHTAGVAWWREHHSLVHDIGIADTVEDYPFPEPDPREPEGYRDAFDAAVWSAISAENEGRMP